PDHPASLVGADQDHVGSLDPVHSSSASFFSPGRNLARKSGFVSSSRWQFRQSGTRSFAEPPQPPIFLPTVRAGSDGPGLPQIAHRISRILSACGPKLRRCSLRLRFGLTGRLLLFFTSARLPESREPTP